MRYIKLMDSYDQLLDSIERAKNSGIFMNCEIFCNLVIGGDKSFKEIYHKVIVNSISYPDLKRGDIIGFGHPDNIRHYAIYMGDSKVYEVEGFGESARENNLSNVLDIYETIGVVYKK